MTKKTEKKKNAKPLARPLRVLVSGGTGFLGDAVVPLLREAGWETTLLSRSKPGCIRADLSHWDGDIDPSEYAGRFDVFLHMAGLYDLESGYVDALRNNCGGTHTALVLAEKMKIPHFVHISTIAVTVGDGAWKVNPDRLDSGRDYPDAYSFSKAQAESLVRAWDGTLASKLILRPGILVGSSITGEIGRIDGPYATFDAVKKAAQLTRAIPGKPVLLPGHEEKTLPLLPVDAAARAIRDLIRISREQDWGGVRSLYLTPQPGISHRNYFRMILDRFGMADRKLEIVPHIPRLVLKPAGEWLVHFPKESMEYLVSMPEFDSSETVNLLGADWCPRLEDYKDIFFDGYETYLSNR